MVLAPEFLIGFDIYKVDLEPTPVRLEAWRLLEPHLDAILDEHFRHVIEHIPVYREALTTKQAPYRALVVAHLRRLFTRRFDDEWPRESVERVKGEVQHGFDARSRPAVARSVLSGLREILLRRRFMSRSAVSTMLEETTGVLLLDVATSVSLHHDHQIRQVKKRTGELADGVSRFAQIVDAVRERRSADAAALGNTGERLRQLAGRVAAEAKVAASGASDTMATSSTMAGAAEELAASISEIHGQADSSANMARGAAAQGEGANATIRELSEIVGKIGSVVNLISDIAAQTNLLALNATIEAARAGDAGRGFAVVASEVKSLATQTTKATQDIGQQIALVQEATRRSVGEIELGSKTAADIATIAESVSAAVNEQAVATGSIAEGAARAASNAATVNEALETIAATVRETSEAAEASVALNNKLVGETAQIDAAIDELFNLAARNDLVRELRALGKTKRA
jgi:methyl-accepting chemotaxis protein